MKKIKVAVTKWEHPLFKQVRAWLAKVPEVKIIEIGNHNSLSFANLGEVDLVVIVNKPPRYLRYAPRTIPVIAVTDTDDLSIILDYAFRYGADYVVSTKAPPPYDDPEVTFLSAVRRFTAEPPRINLLVEDITSWRRGR